MAKQIELFSPQDPTIKSIIDYTRKNSQYTLVRGHDSNLFYDIDEYYLEISRTKDLINKIVEALNILIVNGRKFTKVAFLEKIEGTIGLLPLFSSIQAKIDLPTIIIRLGKDLHRSSIKGSINKKDNILILNDVATSGRTILIAAEKIWSHNAKVSDALVINDRLLGAAQNLAEKDIQLFSFTSVQYKTVIEDSIVSKSIFAYD